MQPPARLRIALLALAILIAIFFRLYDLHHIPPGLHYDEAFDGLEAKRLLRGEGFPIFFEGNFGEEPLSIYLVAGAFALLEESIFNIRLVSALVGIITVPALYLLAKELFRSEEGSLSYLPLWSAFSLATLYWHIHFSRVGIESILLPLFAVLSFYFMWRGFRTGRLPSFALSGIFLGGSLYTYRAARLLPLLFILLWAYRAVMERGFLRRHLWGLTILFSVALLIFAPLGYYFLSHPQIFLDRELGLGIFTSGVGSEAPWATLMSNLGKSLALFSLRGDENPRSNLPGRPALDPFLSLAFIVGCGVSIVRGKQAQYGFLLLWLCVMLLPTTLSEYAPHFRRAIGVTPAVALLVALGLTRLTDFLERLVRRWSSWAKAPQWISLSLIVGGLLCSGLIAFRDYFLIWGPSNDLFYAFDVGLVDMARYIKGLPSQERLYLSPVRSDHPTLLFLLDGVNIKSFDGREGMVLPGDGRATTYLIITHEDETSLPLLRSHLPQGEVVFKGRDRLGETYFVAYRIQKGGPVVSPEHPFSIDLDKVRFLGFDLSTASPHRGDLLGLTLYWQALLEEMKESYTVFTHLLGPYNEATGGPLWGQDDSLPLRGSYPTTQWEKGEIVVDFYHIPVPPEAPAGEYEIEVGMYLLSTMERMSVLGSESDRILLGRIRVEE